MAPAHHQRFIYDASFKTITPVSMSLLSLSKTFSFKIASTDLPAGNGDNGGGGSSSSSNSSIRNNNNNNQLERRCSTSINKNKQSCFHCRNERTHPRNTLVSCAIIFISMAACCKILYCFCFV